MKNLNNTYTREFGAVYDIDLDYRNKTIKKLSTFIDNSRQLTFDVSNAMQKSMSAQRFIRINDRYTANFRVIYNINGKKVFNYSKLGRFIKKIGVLIPQLTENHDE